MAKKKEQIGFKDLKGSWEATNKAISESVKLSEDLENGFSKIFSISTKLRLSEEKINAQMEKMSNIVEQQNNAREAGLQISSYAAKRAKEEYNLERKLLKNLQTKQKIQKSMLVTQKLLGNLLDVQGQFYKYLMDSDAAIRSTNLELGLSGVKAEMLRDSFYQAAQDSAYLGATLKDLRKIQTGFADETGRARVFSGEMLNDVVAMGFGTGMGIEQASKLAGQFDLMGVNVKSAHDYTQNVVDTSERMGVNTTKVFKNISGNFKALQKMTFQQGVKGFAEMATYAEKFKVDMGQMIDSAEKARTLEGAVELAAKLQVMGGEFAKTDPFELLFLSRNDPAAYTKKINEMTKGIITWKKNADGSFEKYLSPADRDRLDSAGKALGLQTGELVQQALRMADISKMRRQMFGMSVNKDQRELIEGMAEVNKNGIFGVRFGSQFKELNDLTKSDISRLKTQQVTLEDRAEQALTFDKVFNNTINTIKAALLPLLDGINIVLEGIRPMLTGLGNFFKQFGAMSGTLKVGAGILAGAAFIISKTIASAGVRGLIAKTNSVMGVGGAAKTAAPTMSGSQALGRGKGAAAAGKGAMMKGAGVGAAGLGIGAGIGIAAVGISKLADSMSKLDKTQIWALPVTIAAMSLSFFALAPAITALGAAGTVSSLGLLALGASVALVGAGIGIAAAGIGHMASGFATLDDVDLSGAAKGIAAISLASMGGILGMGGMASMALGVAGIAASADGIERVGSAFDSIGVVMAGKLSHLEDVKNTIQSIANINMSKDNPMSQLTNLFNKPLQVEFADKDVSMNVELILDGDVIFKKLQSNTILTKQDDAQKLGYNA